MRARMGAVAKFIAEAMVFLASMGGIITGLYLIHIIINS